MKSRCFFTKSPLAVLKTIEDILKTDHCECICVYNKKSKLYTTELLKIGGISFFEFDDYGKETDYIFKDNSDNIMIVIGLTDMIRPSNRCDIRFEYMYNFSKYKAKFVIDTVPFLVDKWRAWYPWGVISTEILSYPHSYAFESAYSSYREGLSQEDPCDINMLTDKLWPYTIIDYKRFFDFDAKFMIHETTNKQKEEYELLKNELFETEKTITPIIRKLWMYTRSILPEHNLFIDKKKVYKAKSDIEIHLTDLKIDLHLKSELEKLINDTNALTEGLYGKQNLFR